MLSHHQINHTDKAKESDAGLTAGTKSKIVGKARVQNHAKIWHFFIFLR